MRPPAPIKVVFRFGQIEHDMGLLPDQYNSPRDLDPYISQLISRGIHRGRVVFINVTTGGIVASRVVKVPQRLLTSNPPADAIQL